MADGEQELSQRASPRIVPLLTNQHYNGHQRPFLEVSLSPLERFSEAEYQLIVTLRNTLDEPRSYRRVVLASQSTGYFEPASAAIGEIQPQADVSCPLYLVQRSRAQSCDMPRQIALNIQTADPQIILQVEKELETGEKDLFVACLNSHYEIL